MSLISGFPSGLLSLVGSQNFGVAPKELGQVVSPVVDLTRLYLLGKQESVTRVFSAPANGTNNGQGLVVPSGEVWMVQGGGMLVIAGAGVTGDFTPTLLGSNINATPLADTAPLTGAAAQTRAKAWVQLPLWLQAGQELGVYIQNLVGVPSVTVGAMITRLRA